jgi:hypothetical protein
MDAIRVALQALEERATTTRWLLDDPTLYGLVAEATVRSTLQRDDAAVALLRETVSATHT